ncbi:hypothetical protein [Candidatus Cyanaurora vandensis]|uniref:hypothetical protein n=1 Tax=Candidatus Cyanaurora vandensis TaxID=2714958 RepID=UPI00257A9BE2|nr:hypothetical protein [Candidatus Cyanaurora vandensis]
MNPTPLLAQLTYAEALSAACTQRLQTITEDTQTLINAMDLLLEHSQTQLQVITHQLLLGMDEADLSSMPYG